MKIILLIYLSMLNVCNAFAMYNGNNPFGYNGHPTEFNGSFVDNKFSPSAPPVDLDDALFQTINAYDAQDHLSNAQDINALDSRGYLPICKMIRASDFVNAKAIINNKLFDANISESDGNTALHEAIRIWDKEIISLLFQKNANHYAIDGAGVTPLDLVKNNIEKYKYLMSLINDRVNQVKPQLNKSAQDDLKVNLNNENSSFGSTIIGIGAGALITYISYKLFFNKNKKQ